MPQTSYSSRVDNSFSMFMPNLSITTPSPPSLSSSSTSPVSQSPMLGSSALNKTNCNSFYRALQNEKNKQNDLIKLIQRTKSSAVNSMQKSDIDCMPFKIANFNRGFDKLQYDHLNKRQKLNDSDNQKHLFYSQLVSLLQHQNQQQSNLYVNQQIVYPKLNCTNIMKPLFTDIVRF